MDLNRGPTMLAHEGNKRPIITPNDVLDRRTIDLSDGLLLLNIVENHGGCRAQDKTSSAPIEDLICLNRGFDRLNSRI